MIKSYDYFNTLPVDAKINMNVHDEIVLDLPKKENKGNLPIVKRVREIMEYVGDCIDVNLTSGMTYHPDNWSEGEDL